jgi:hypothetical protein
MRTSPLGFAAGAIELGQHWSKLGLMPVQPELCSCLQATVRALESLISWVHGGAVHLLGLVVEFVLACWLLLVVRAMYQRRHRGVWLNTLYPMAWTYVLDVGVSTP